MGKGIVDELKKEFQIEDTWLPFEIHPDTPVDGRKLTEMFPQGRLAAMIASLKSNGAQYGLQFNQLELLSNSHLSLLGGEFTRDKGKFHEYHEEVFRAYFTDGKDIGSTEVLNNILDGLQLDAAEFAASVDNGIYEDRLNQTSESAHINGINSTPTFIINDKYAVVGAQPVEAFRRALIDMEKGNL